MWTGERFPIESRVRHMPGAAFFCPRRVSPFSPRKITFPSLTFDENGAIIALAPRALFSQRSRNSHGKERLVSPRRFVGRYGHDSGFALAEDLSLQHPADAVADSAGHLQHGGRGRGGQIRQRAGAGLGRLDLDAGFAVHRLSDRPGRGRKRAGSPASGREAPPRDRGDGAHLAADLPAGGRDHQRAVPAAGRADAQADEHQGRPDRRRGAVFPHLRAGHARAGRVQLRQRRDERQRRHAPPAAVSDRRRRAEHPAEPVLRDLLRHGGGRRGAGEHHFPVRLGHTDRHPSAARAGRLRPQALAAALPSGAVAGRAGAGHSRGPSERHLRHRQHLYSDGPELLRLRGDGGRPRTPTR